MPVTVIVGGQFGSEGKDKVAHYLAREQCAAVAVRVGGSKSGHTVIGGSGVPRVFQALPIPGPTGQCDLRSWRRKLHRC